MYDYLLVGSGLFNAVFASEAKKANKTCFVLERRSHIGGNVYTEEIEEIQVHKYGAHIFRTSIKEIWDYINQFATFNHFINSPIANYKGEIYNLPFNMNTFNQMWKISTPKEAEEIINKQKKEVSGAPKNLEEKAISLVGRDIYEKLIKEYTEKQWGRECKNLPPSILRRLPVRFTYDNNYFNDPYQGIPLGGYTNIIEKMLDGHDVILNTDFNQSKEKYKDMAKKIIYTGTIDSYYDFCYGKLAYRSLKFETEVVDEKNFQGVAVMNYTSSDEAYTRIIEHKHFEFGKQKKTVVTREYPLEWNIHLEPYYPVNDEANQALYQKYIDLSKRDPNIIFAGRLGEYKYTDMQDTIISALALAKNLI